MDQPTVVAVARVRHSPLEVLAIAFRMGCTSFGGPVAHLGYFREAFVVRRRWLDERAFADLVALCQFLPGPASSQVFFALGLMRAGYLGGLAAWVGFILPSAIALVRFAYGASAMTSALGQVLLHGLQLVAVAVVAQAVLGMARSLCPDRARATIAAAALILMSVVSGSLSQVGAIVLGSIAGLVVCRTTADTAPEDGPSPVSHRMGIVFLVVFFVLLALSLAPVREGAGALAAAFYRSGALVFGGGHVVLPLLRDAVVAPGWVPDDAFIAGYGAAQAVPGPLFTFAAYLGAVADVAPGGVAGAGHAGAAGHAAVLARPARAAPRARRDGRRQRRRDRAAGRRPLQSGVDQRSTWASGFRRGGGGVRVTGRVAGAGTPGGGAARTCGTRRAAIGFVTRPAVDLLHGRGMLRTHRKDGSEP